MASTLLPREGEARELARSGDGLKRASRESGRIINDEVLVARLHGEVAVDDFRCESPLVERLLLKPLEHRRRRLIGQLLEFFLAELALLEAPLPAKKRIGVDVRKQMPRRDVGDRPTTPERRDRH